MRHACFVPKLSINPWEHQVIFDHTTFCHFQLVHASPITPSWYCTDKLHTSVLYVPEFAISYSIVVVIYWATQFNFKLIYIKNDVFCIKLYIDLFTTLLIDAVTCTWCIKYSIPIWHIEIIFCNNLSEIYSHVDFYTTALFIMSLPAIDHPLHFLYYLFRINTDDHLNITFRFCFR